MKRRSKEELNQIYKEAQRDIENGVSIKRTLKKFGIGRNGFIIYLSKKGLYNPQKPISPSPGELFWMNNKDNTSIAKVAKIFKENEHTMAKNLTFLGYDTSYKPIPKNESIFETIDTEEKAYWLGFLYADGSVSKELDDKHKHKNAIEITLCIKDYEHLVKFANFLGFPSDKISIRDSKPNKSCRIQVSSKKMREDLINKGCTPQKSLNLSFPSYEQVPKHLMKHFVRGFIDGDGSLGIYNNGKRKVLHVVGTYEMIKGIQEEMGFRKLKIRPKFNSFEITWAGEYVTDYWAKLYQDSTIYLTRKYEIAMPFFTEM